MEQTPQDVNESPEAVRKEVMFVLDTEGNKRARAEIFCITSPMRLGYVRKIEVMNEQMSERGQGYGSEMLEKVNQFLEENNMVGILFNTAFTTVDMYDVKTRTPFREKINLPHFYTNHGWKDFPVNPDWKTYRAEHFGISAKQIWNAYLLLADRCNF